MTTDDQKLVFPIFILQPWALSSGNEFLSFWMMGPGISKHNMSQDKGPLFDS